MVHLGTEEWPFVGRVEESAVVADVLGRSGCRGVVIAGAAGVGKSRLARVAVEAAGRRGGVTRWVVATRSAASIPFGALAGVLPPREPPIAESPLALLRELSGALLALGGDGGLVLGVDDAHLLDDGSAALVGQLVASGRCRVVLTVRSGEPEPDAIASLWKERIVDYLELQPLTAGEVEDLLRAALGGDVDGATVLRLFEISRGTPLFVRELVADGLETGRLEDNGGVWRWAGGLEAGPRLREIVASRLGRLSGEDGRLLELVAVGEPLELGVVERLAALAPLVALESRGLVEVVRDGRRSHVRLAHPLFGEVLRAGKPRIGMRVACGALAEAIAGLGTRRREDRLRAAVWALEGWDTRSPDLLARGARAALAAFDTALAQRLARAALDAGGGLEAAELLGRALTGGGRFAEAEELLASVGADARTDEARLALATARVTNLLWGLGRADEAVDVALRAEEQVQRDDLRYELRAFRAQVLWVSGHPGEGSRVLSEIPSEGVSDRVGLLVALHQIGFLGVHGRCEEACALADRWYPVALSLESDSPYEVGPVYASSTIQSERMLALWLAGRLDQAQAVAESQYRVALDRHSTVASAMWSMILGALWLLRGRPQTALRWLREGAAGFRECDPVGHFPWCLAFLAQALATLGDAAGAQAAIDEADAVRRPGIRVFEVSLDLARGWAAAARGELPAAREWARRAAEQAERTDQLAFAVLAYSDLVLFGEPASAADRLQELARSVDGPLVTACARYAPAAAGNDGVALDRAASELEQLGTMLLAAHAAALAVGAHRAAGRAASARASAARARALLAGCEGARPPTIGPGDEAEPLTDREHEIATLAAQGLPNHAIADRLVLSVRTVENHLQHAYTKFGVAARGQLAAALGGIDPATAPETARQSE